MGSNRGRIGETYHLAKPYEGIAVQVTASRGERPLLPPQGLPHVRTALHLDRERTERKANESNRSFIASTISGEVVAVEDQGDRDVAFNENGDGGGGAELSKAGHCRRPLVTTPTATGPARGCRRQDISKENGEFPSYPELTQKRRLVWCAPVAIS